MLLRETVIALEAGSVVDGRYQIRRLVGKGATGVVLEADDRVSRELVALKVFKPEIATDERWLEIVGSELRHARLLQHPNVCRVFDAGSSGGYRFLTMEFASGGSLRQQLREGATERPEEERVADARAVVEGLAAIHRAGIIHRDVKPDNVLRMKDGRLVVTDFGLAVAPGQTTFVSGYSGAVGTPSYMAPEVALGGDATMASDVFSLGVILHELFFDRRPDWDTTKRGRFLRSPVDGSSSRLARAMAQVCADCLEELAPRRPRDAEEVRKRFERAVLGRTGSTLQALRTGKGALLLGLVGAAAAASVVFVVTRPGQQIVQAQMVGTAIDWRPGARRITRKDGRLRCLYPSADGRSVRLLWGNLRVPEIVDLATGASTPWALAAEMLGRGCPEWAADGQTVVFLGGQGYADIMLSPNPDGSGARKLTSGYRPKWLPGGRELVFAFGRQRVAVTDLGGFPQLLPEAATAGETLFDLAVSSRGRVAVLYRHPVTGRSSLVLYEFPSWAIQSRIELGAKVSRVFFAPDSEEPSLIVEDGVSHVVAVVKPDGDVVRKGKLAGAEIIDMAATPSGGIVAALQRSVTAVLLTPGGTERELFVAPDVGRTSVSQDGNRTIMPRLLDDGRWVVARYDRDTNQVTRLTEGPNDGDPLLMPNGREFLFLQGKAPRRVRLCSLQVPSECRTLAEDPGAYLLMGVSPTGRQVAYATFQGTQYRLRVATATGRTTDLGPINSPCRLRWSAEDRLWAFERSSTFTGWVEMKVDAGAPTGRREPAGPLGIDACPENPSPLGETAVRLRTRTETTLYKIGRSL